MRMKSCMLDFDGTVTHKGSTDMAEEVKSRLISYAEKQPLAFCTGRSIPFVREKIFDSLMEALDLDRRRKINQNLYIFAENGSVGGRFSDCGSGFEKFYEISWPEHIDKNILLELLKREFPYGLEWPEHKFDIAFVFRAYTKDGGYILGKDVRERFINVTKKVYPNIEDELYLGASKRSLTIGPANGDKDYAIRNYADILRIERRMELSETLEDLLIVGNNPQKGGNDYKFLNSDLGKRYTVENYEDGASYGVVRDDDGKAIQNANGMVHLWDKYFGDAL